MKYIAIEELNVDDLNETVNKMILEGWKPVGGVSVSLSESDDYQYFTASQALILEDD